MHHFFTDYFIQRYTQTLPAHRSPASAAKGRLSLPPLNLPSPTALGIFFREVRNSAVSSNRRTQVSGPEAQAVSANRRSQASGPSAIHPKAYKGCFLPERPPSTHTGPIAALGDTGTHRTHHDKHKQACDLHPPHTAPAREKGGPEPRTVAASA